MPLLSAASGRLLQRIGLANGRLQLVLLCNLHGYINAIPSVWLHMKGSGGAARSAREAWAHACLGPVPFWAPCSALVSPAGLLVVLLWAALVAGGRAPRRDAQPHGRLPARLCLLRATPGVSCGGFAYIL